MKNPIVLLVSLFLVLSISSNAQIEKGNIFLGTTVNVVGNPIGFFSTQPNNVGISFGTATSKYGNFESKQDVTIFNFAPQVGYFFTDGFVGGANVNFLYYSVKDRDDDEKNSIRLFQAGPFVRYYIEMEKAKPYIYANASFGGLSDGDEDSANVMGFGGGAGAAFFLNDFVSFDVLVGYNFSKIKEDNNTTFNSEDTFGNFALAVGFTVILGNDDDKSDD